MTSHKAPLQLASCISIVALDVLVYAATMLGHAHGFLAISAVGAVLTLALVSALEHRAGSTPLHAFAKGTLGGLAVAIPLPIVGTVVGLVGLFWHWTAERRSQRV